MIFCVFAAPAPADEHSAGDRPRIGLVLGGGGAKGAAHIGVLRVLDELRIPIACVAGTSMGALVGGTFASGMPVAEIERITTGIDWSRTVGGKGLRDSMPIERKLEGISYTNNIELGIRNGGIVLPGGLLKTQDIEDLIRDLVNSAQFQRDFDYLPIPFRAVATDMVSGEMVVLGSGDLSVAMRASMSVPGAFSPVIRGDEVLADGGMVRNIPIDIARELCADVVIAIWFSEPQPTAAELDSVLALVTRSMDVMIQANERIQIGSLTPDDIGIEVAMGDIGSGDFQRVEDAIVLGRAAAEAHISELSRFSIPQADYLAWRDSMTTAAAKRVRLAEVRVEGLKHVSPEYVEAHLANLQAGADVDSRQIKADTDRVYALGDFERIEHRLKGTPDNRVIEVAPIEKSWGPNFLRFDLGLSAEDSGELLAILRADHTRTWIGDRGARWRNSLQLGRQTLLSTEFYQPLNFAQDFFVRPAIRYENNLQGVYLGNEQVARYFIKDFYGELAFGANMGTRAQIVTGLQFGEMAAQIDIGPPILPEQDWERDTNFFLTLAYDTRDNIGLPTRGSLINLRYVHSDSWLGGEQNYDLAEGVLTKSFPSWRGDSMSLIIGGGARLAGVIPAARDFRLGGIRSFPGLRFDQLRGTNYWFAGTSYLWKLADIQPLLGQALYAGLRLQAGRMTGREELFLNPDTLYGISGSLNGRTPVGPFILSLGYVNDGSLELQFTIGRPIPEGSALDYIQ
jgi:NTE family protein